MAAAKAQLKKNPLMANMDIGIAVGIIGILMVMILPMPTQVLDLLLAMTQESLDKYYPDLKENGTLIVDETIVTEIPTDNYYALPFTRLAREEAGHIMVANVIALGAIGAITGMVSHEVLVEAVLARAPRGTEDKNRKAVEIGFREGARLLKEKTGHK